MAHRQQTLAAPALVDPAGCGILRLGSLGFTIYVCARCARMAGYCMLCAQANCLFVLCGCAVARFWHFVSQQPVRILEVPDDQTEQEPVQMEAPRFMAVVWGAGQDGDGPTTIVQLDGQGGSCVESAA